LGAKPGVGSAYTWTYRDMDGEWIDPARTYALRLPGPIPAKDFWSVVVSWATREQRIFELENILDERH
jgi:hypothetical protein